MIIDLWLFISSGSGIFQRIIWSVGLFKSKMQHKTLQRNESVHLCSATFPCSIMQCQQVQVSRGIEFKPSVSSSSCASFLAPEWLPQSQTTESTAYGTWLDASCCMAASTLSRLQLPFAAFHAGNYPWMGASGCCPLAREGVHVS